MEQLSAAIVAREAFAGYVDTMGSKVRWRPGFIPCHKAAAWFSQMRLSIPWRREFIRCFGKVHQEPRAIFAVGSASVTYAGKAIESVPWDQAPAVLRDMRQRVQEECGSHFNVALCNLYETGADSVGWHADDETIYGEDPVIASISLGATRDFLVRPVVREHGTRSMTMPLQNGDLFVMEGAFQEQWQHSLPKRARAQSRVSMSHSA